MEADSIKKVLDNRDPYRMGRVLTDKGWVVPISSKTGEFTVPEIGEYITICQECYYVR